MSIQAYKQNMGKPKEYTFESLSQSLDELSRQVTRTKSAIEKLSDENSYDLRMMARLNHTQKDNKEKIGRYSQTLTDLRRKDSQNPLDADCDFKISTIRKTINELDALIGPISERHEKRRIEEEENARQMAAEKAQLNELQMRQRQQHSDVTFVKNNAAEIVNGMTELNDLTNQLAEKIDDQHEIVVHVDETIEEAKEEMIEGNAVLEEAEEIQQSTPLCCMVL